MKKINVIFSASEMSPYAKTGGLADVVSELPKALFRQGNVDVFTVIPKYGFIDDSRYNLREIDRPLRFSISGAPYESRAKYLEFDGGRRAYFIENAGILGRSGMYGYNDDAYRFAFLARATMELARLLDFKPDVIHCHDWHAGLIPVYLKTIYREDPFFRSTATVFTIHNLAYQGIFPKDLLPYLGIGWEEFKYEKLEYWDNINFMKAGISYSDVINTVSKQYSMEIQTPEYGETLDGLLRQRSNNLYGIINGIDYDTWDPATDKSLIKNYNENSIDNKIENKLALQKEFGLPQGPQIPVAGVVTRLSYQKGLDIIVEAAHDMASMGVQLVVLGTGEEYYQHLFQKLAHDYSDNVGIRMAFDDTLARQIYAGSDMFLMPSRYEPCGLSQLISMRYGAVPIVRRTGGLTDTVAEYVDGKGTGFLFDNPSPWELVSAIKKAKDVFEDSENWKQLVSNCMKSNFSWGKSAEEYMNLYEKAISML